MNWGQSYSSYWRVYRVNRKTWADAEQITNIDNVRITRTADGKLLESGDIEITGDIEPDYYRIVMTAQQGGDIERVDIATLLFDRQGGQVDHNMTIQKPEGYSVLHPAETTATIIGEYAHAGSDGAKYAGELLASAINAPVVVEGSFILNEHVVHELGSSVLDAVWTVLNAGNFIMQIDGRGVVHILPMPTAPSLVIDNATKRIMSNGISYTSDISDVPNRYVVIQGTTVTTAVNDDPNSPISTVNRGYFVDLVDTSPTLINGETFSGYARRMLEKSSIQKEEKNYSREYAPNVYPYSIIKASIDGLFGDYRIMSQTIDCANGLQLRERATKETALWSMTQFMNL